MKIFHVLKHDDLSKSFYLDKINNSFFDVKIQHLTILESFGEMDKTIENLFFSNTFSINSYITALFHVGIELDEHCG